MLIYTPSSLLQLTLPVLRSSHSKQYTDHTNVRLWGKHNQQVLRTQGTERKLEKLHKEQLHNFMPTSQFGSHKMKEDRIGDAYRKLGDETNIYEEENPEGKPKSKINIIQIGFE